MIKIFLFTLFAACTINIGFAQSNQQKIDSLKILLQKQNTNTDRFWNIIRIGDVYRAANNDSALLYYNDALSLSQKSEFKAGQFFSRNRIANVFKDKNDYAIALDLFLQNIREAEQTGDTTMIFIDTRDVGFIYEIIEDVDRQLEYTNKLRSLINSGIYKDSANLSEYRIMIHNRFGGLYDKLNNLDSGKFYKLKVYQYGLKYNDQGWIAHGAAGLGNIYRNQSNKDSAIYYYRAAIPAALAHERLDIYGRALLGLGKTYLESKQADSAFYYTQKAFTLSQQANNLLNMMEAVTLLSEIYYAKNETDSAYKYLKKSMVLKDSVFSSEKKSRIQNLSFKESIRKQQQEQDKKEALASYKSKVQTYGFITGFALMLGVIFILFRNNRQRNLANKKIEKAFHELKSTQSQLIQSEKMASLGELTAGIAHEIQNPLNFVNNFSEVSSELIKEMVEEVDKGNTEEVKAIANDVVQNLEKINHHGKRAADIVKGMLQHSRSSSGVKEPTDINALADEYLRLAYHGLRAKDKSFNAIMKTDFDSAIPKLNVVPQDIGRVILNLITNAFYVVNERQKLLANSHELLANYEPTVSVSTKKEGNKVLISVRDNGNGIPQKILDKIFQPFFTTKPTGQGTGLGLSLSYDIVKAHSGELKVETKEGEGSEFTIGLPL